MTDQKEYPSNLVIKNARILPGGFRNFSGSPTKYDPKGGKRTFAVEIPEDSTEKLLEDGWFLKIQKPRDDEEEQHPRYFITVKINFDYKPPIIKMHTGKTEKRLDEETINCLDYADYKYGHVSIRPSRWIDDDGNARFSGYLKTLHVFIEEEDEFEEDFAEEESPEELPFD